MSKTYAPQCIRMCRRLRLYINKHRTTMAPFLSAPQLAALDAIEAAIAAFDGVLIQEAP